MYCVKKITEDLTWVGSNDRRLALFEGVYSVPRGVSYNSYVLMDEKTVLMDTVDKAVTGVFFENIAHVLNGRKLDYMVIQHMEPDHSGSIARLAELFPEMTLVGNAKTFGMLNQFFDFPVEERKLVVKEGDSLSLGSHTLNFIMAPMIHWPEVMVTYESSEKILFSADAFGKFGALDSEDEEGWACEGRRYYFNIVGKYGAPVQTLLKKVAKLDVACICPLHGPVLNENLEYYVNLYDTWSSYRPEDKGIFIACASIHGNTAAAAEKLAEILRQKGAEKVVVRDLARFDMGEAVEDAFRYDRMILAAASYDGGVFPCMQDFLHHLQSKAYQNRKVGILENGSWAPSAAKTMKGILETMKNVTVVEPAVTIRSTLKEADLPMLEKLADAMV